MKFKLEDRVRLIPEKRIPGLVEGALGRVVHLGTYNGPGQLDLVHVEFAGFPFPFPLPGVWLIGENGLDRVLKDL